MSIFTMHRSIPLNEWISEEALKRSESADIPDEPVDSKFNYILDPNDFEAFINPRLVGETVTHEHQWEYCPSFPQMRCMVRRPIAIEVQYIDEQFNDVTSKLHDFRARVFLHELDHVNGQSMLHWRLNEGNIDILPDPQHDNPEEFNPNLNATVNFYKTKINALKRDFYQVFEDKRLHDLTIDNKSQTEWKKFKRETSRSERGGDYNGDDVLRS